MKKYNVVDHQQGNFMDYTEDDPMTASELRSHFWAYDESRTTHYKYFTLAYIEEAWLVEFKEAR